MIDLISAVQAAFIAVLDAGIEAGDAQVLDHVPQGTEPNFVELGSIEFQNEGDKEDPRFRFEVEVHTVYRGSDRSELLALMNKVHEAVLEGELTSPAIAFSSPELISGAASKAASDGVTYAGLSLFEVYAEPA